MPILMMALLALACFGLIGFLQAMAGMLERKKLHEASGSSKSTVLLWRKANRLSAAGRCWERLAFTSEKFTSELSAARRVQVRACPSSAT